MYRRCSRPPQQCALPQSLLSIPALPDCYERRERWASIRAGPRSGALPHPVRRAGAALESAGAGTPCCDQLSGWRASAPNLGQNVLADEKSFAMILEEGDLAGLPDFARAAARAAAEERGHPGKLCRHPGALVSRKLSAVFVRGETCAKKAFQAWIRRGENGGTTDNRTLIAEMVAPAGRTGKAARLCDLRRLSARRSDGETPAAARGLLDEVWGRARAEAAGERDACRRSPKRAATSRCAPHDWRYYTEKLRKAQYDLDEAEIKPYFQLEEDDRGGVRNGGPAVRPLVPARSACPLSLGALRDKVAS